MEKNAASRNIIYILKNWELYLFLLPVIVYYVVFHYIPMYGVTLAFKDFVFADGILGSPWVGFKHFELLFSGRTFFEVFSNTLIISSLKLVFGFPAPIILALLLSEIRNRMFLKTVQTISYLPHFLSWIILSGLLTQILSPSSGFVNYVLQLFGVKPISWPARNGSGPFWWFQASGRRWGGDPSSIWPRLPVSARSCTKHPG